MLSAGIERIDGHGGPDAHDTGGTGFQASCTDHRHPAIDTDLCRIRVAAAHSARAGARRYEGRFHREDTAQTFACNLRNVIAADITDDDALGAIATQHMRCELLAGPVAMNGCRLHSQRATVCVRPFDARIADVDEQHHRDARTLTSPDMKRRDSPSTSTSNAPSRSTPVAMPVMV